VAYYSFIVLSPNPVSFVDPLILLDRGRNLFSAEVEDVAAFRQALKDEGCRILQENLLSQSSAETEDSIAHLVLNGVDYADGTQRLPGPPRPPAEFDAGQAKGKASKSGRS
jgi:hypothetical protein